MPWIWPDLSETIFVSAPASSSACLGFVISTCSKPSVTRMATFFPSNFRAINPPLELTDLVDKRRHRAVRASIIIVLRRQRHSMDVADFAAQRKERHMNQCRSDRGKQPRMILRSKGKYGVCGSKFSAFLRNIFRPFAPRGFKDNCQSGSDFHFGVSRSRDYTSQLLKPPMWRNGRRNGLKIRWAEKARAGSNPAIGNPQNSTKFTELTELKKIW